MIDSNVEQQIISLVASQTAVPEKRISLKTTLFGDLQVDGDDAEDLFEEFRARFHVDLSSLDLTKHFHSEVSIAWTGLGAPFLWLAYWLRAGCTPEEKCGLTPISVGDLVDAARRGRW